ncbi:MAG: tryptophan synthase subunit beta, partial [Deltaproteobacteria bacterium]|nr:tryptophan synthase subunit beta [Deltaproteobacteria bacterium]
MKDRGYYKKFGGAYLPEILVATFDELVEIFQTAKNDPGFWEEYVDIMSTYSCRPTPITFAQNLTQKFGGAR